MIISNTLNEYSRKLALLLKDKGYDIFIIDTYNISRNDLNEVINKITITKKKFCVFVATFIDNSATTKEDKIIKYLLNACMSMNKKIYFYLEEVWKYLPIRNNLNKIFNSKNIYTIISIQSISHIDEKYIKKFDYFIYMGDDTKTEKYIMDNNSQIQYEDLKENAVLIKNNSLIIGSKLDMIKETLN